MDRPIPPGMARALCAAVILMIAASATQALAAGEPPEAGRARVTVLNTAGFFRCHFTWRTIQMRRASGELELVGVTPQWGRAPKLAKAKHVTCTPPPPKDWASPDFDDSAWVRARGPFFTRLCPQWALLCLRGKFHVPDPARAGDLALSLSFRGGAVVYVNGREVSRSHLPKGKLGPLAPADDYPKDAYADPDGYLLRWVGFGDPEKYGDRFLLRTRHVANLKVPASMLRKGLNVLAVEVHRAPTAEILFTGKPRQHTRGYTVWSMLGVTKVALSAPPGSNVRPNIRRAKGLRAWTHPTLQSLHNVDYGDPNELLQPLRICGARNGTFSAQFVVESDRAVRGLKVTPGELKAGNGAAIPGSAVDVRYALPGDHAEGGTERYYRHSGGTEVRYPRGTRRFDGLADEPPAEVSANDADGGAAHPVWITVRVPRDARPGVYSGTAAVNLEGHKPIEAPLRLSVADWALPDPHEFRTHAGLIQSPDSLAMRYKVPMWSEKHWKLIERSFEITARAGNKVVYLPVIRRTYFGNEHSMVRWIRQARGSYKHDFSIVERYVATAVKHLKKPPVVCVYCWEVSTGSTYMSGRHHHVKNVGMPFTVLDPKTGKLEKADGPAWGSKEIRAFWKPVFGGIRKILARHGLEKSMMVGICGDRRAHKDAVEDLRAVAPDAGWVMASHNMPVRLHGQLVGYGTGVWGLGPAPSPRVKRYYGWKSPLRRAAFPRYGASVVGHSLRITSPLGVYRASTEAALTGARGRLQGIGRCGADFWPLIKVKYSMRPICGRYPETSGWHGGWLHNSFPYILAAGRDGAIPTVRFEMFREGVQESEARIAVEKVLTDPAAKLDARLAARCQAALDSRVSAYLHAIEGGGTYVSWIGFIGSGWQERSWDLFAAAAAATGGKAPTPEEKAVFFGN